MAKVPLKEHRSCLVWGEMREQEGSPRIYLAEKRMPWGQLKFR